VLNQKALDANNRLADRFRIVRAWLDAHPEAHDKLRYLDARFAAWDAYEDESILFRDPGALLVFESDCAEAENEAARFGYKPGERVVVGDVVGLTPGGDAAQATSDAVDELERKAKDAADKAPGAVPWWAWALGLGGLAAVGIGLGVAVQLNPAVALARASMDNGRNRKDY